MLLQELPLVLVFSFSGKSITDSAGLGDAHAIWTSFTASYLPGHYILIASGDTKLAQNRVSYLLCTQVFNFIVGHSVPPFPRF